MSSKVMKRYFTPSEATKTLSYVKRIVEDILKTGNEARALEERIEDENCEEELEDYMCKMNRYYKELELVGCSYRDWNFELGLVDFPAVIDGREVLLCWRSDEESLEYYHDLHTGYDRRKPIPKELLEEDPSDEESEVLTDARL